MSHMNTFIHDNLELDYLIHGNVIQMHAIFRLFSPEGELLEKIGMLEDDRDPVMCDDSFRAHLLDHAGEDHPYLYYELEHVVYAALRLKEGAALVAGPVSFVPTYAELNQQVMEAHGIPEAMAYRLSFCPRQYFVAGILNIFHMVTGKRLGVDELWYKNFMDDTVRSTLEKNLMVDVSTQQTGEMAHTPYQKELREMECIRKGDMEGLRKVLAEPVVGERGRLAKDPLRQAKNVAVAIITLAGRAAIDGGVNPELAFTINDSYIRMAESVRTVEQVEMLMSEAEFKLADLVKQHNTREQLPHPLIPKIKDYIFRNLQTDIKVGDMAQMFEVNPDYLSFLFHKHTGKTISRYVLEERTRAAESMLIYSDNSLQEIAFVLNFSSQSHFSTVFRKITGYTPKEYRDTFRVNVE